jgi:hypothetical protein
MAGMGSGDVQGWSQANSFRESGVEAQNNPSPTEQGLNNRHLQTVEPFQMQHNLLPSGRWRAECGAGPDGLGGSPGAAPAFKRAGLDWGAAAYPPPAPSMKPTKRSLGIVLFVLLHQLPGLVSLRLHWPVGTLSKTCCLHPAGPAPMHHGCVGTDRGTELAQDACIQQYGSLVLAATVE